MLSNASIRSAKSSTSTAFKTFVIALSAEERRRLLGAMQDDVKPMVQAMTLLSFRPAVFARLIVADFDQRQAVLRVDRDKKAKDRYVPLSDVSVCETNRGT